MTTITKEDVVQAYKQLKSYAYYETSNQFLRWKVAEFEAGLESIDGGLQKIADAITRFSLVMKLQLTVILVQSTSTTIQN
jgi:hypothetical protein